MRKVLEEFVKAVLYAFPVLEEMEEEYETHIRNKAVLSYKSQLPTEELAEYIVKEIIEKQRMQWLKRTVGGVLDRLNDLEKTLIAVRYFGKKRKWKDRPQIALFDDWSESKYFRTQQRLGEKVAAMLKSAGVTQALFEGWFLPTELFTCIHKYLTRAEQKGLKREKSWLAQKSSCS